MRIILLGPQGAGKGTYAATLSEKFKIPHISIGEMYRSIPQEDPLYKTIRSKIDAGHFVSDDITYKILFQRLSQSDAKKGFILDGYPRNVHQARSFDLMINELGIKIDHIFFVEIPEKETIRRLSGRLSCSCGEIYNNATNPPKIKGKCDACGKDLFTRADDTPEGIKERLKIYKQNTEPVKDYFGKKATIVDGMGSIESVFKRIFKLLQ